MSAFQIVIPAVKGVQAGRDFYLSAMPLRHVTQILGPDTGGPARVAEPAFNKKRIREVARYMADNPTQYILSPLIACIDGDVEFETGLDRPGVNVGSLRIGMNARISLSDGRQSIAAIEAALAANHRLSDESVPVVFIPDAGLKRCRQKFADLARYSIRNSSSLNVLYDQRDEAAQLAKGVMRAVPLFAELTETAKSCISNRSTKLFTLSAIHSATQALLAGIEADDLAGKVELAAEFWTEVGRQIPAWQKAKDHEIATADLRRDFVHAHALALAAIARAGNQLLATHRRKWKSKLNKLSTLDWSRANIAQWEGRAMNAGRLSKRSVNVILTGNLIKRQLELGLSPDEQKLEREFRNTHRGADAKR
jgi:DNA sulfur modification protein DndB